MAVVHSGLGFAASCLSTVQLAHECHANLIIQCMDGFHHHLFADSQLAHSCNFVTFVILVWNKSNIHHVVRQLASLVFLS
jgi:hypothetical protein